MIKSILSDPRTAKEFKIRGITRDPSKPSAQALLKQGVEPVAVCVSNASANRWGKLFANGRLVLSG